MDNINQQPPSSNTEDISLKDITLKLENLWRYLLSKWVTILIAVAIGAVIGLTFSIFSKPSYTAVTTFVLDDGGKSGLGQYASLASLAGINLDNSGGGLFQSDNIVQLYTSRTMIEKTLLTKSSFDSKEKLLIDQYIDFKDLRDKWKNKETLKSINFKGDPTHFTRTQDSIITVITEDINKNCLSVTKGDTKSSIIQVEVNAKDELFAMIFTERLVENVNGFYTATKTKRAVDNLAVLQNEADSVRRVLNLSINGVATSIDAAPNANPNMLSLRVPSQKKQVDVQANTAIYAEIVKNLEISRMSLLQAKPLIQVIDNPVLPLKKSKIGKILGIITGGFLAAFITIFGLLILKKVKSF